MFIPRPRSDKKKRGKSESVANLDLFQAGAEVSSDHKVVFFMNK